MKNDIANNRTIIVNGQAILGIELGSTRIKAVLITTDNKIIASGSHAWENSYIQNNWTYHLDEIWNGIQSCYTDLIQNIHHTYGVNLTRLAALGISAMMHGYLAFDKQDQLLTPFRTWRNNYTLEASTQLMELFQYPIPQRWSISHLYQAILNKEPHVVDLNYLTTLSGYVHWQLTGEKNLGVGDAAGMFPIDIQTSSFNTTMIQQFDDLISPQCYPWKLADVLPKTQIAGAYSGVLTETGAKLLDPTGQLESGCPLCPPEGDAGTGMVATNSVAVRTANVSAGTSIFAMIVLEKELSQVHPELDLVTTPSGKLVAMAHSNNCTSNLDSWMDLFAEVNDILGGSTSKTHLYTALYQKALEGDKDCGGLLAYGYLSGEHMTHFEAGRPLFARTPESKFNLANFMRVNLQTSLGAMKIGLDILFQQEQVKVDKVLGHGGLFKTPVVGQSLMAAAFNAPVTVMDNASEGGAWGIALLASYLIHPSKQNLEDFLTNHVFTTIESITIQPDPADVAGFETFMERYITCLPVERAVVDCLT